MLGPTKPTSISNQTDPPPPYRKSLSHPSPLSLSDHLAPPPSYSRARELSESDSTFLPIEMSSMENIQEDEIEDVNEEEDIDDNNSDAANDEISPCADSTNLRCVYCLHRLHI